MGIRSRWIARFAFLFLAAAIVISFVWDDADSAAYTFLLMGVGLLAFLSCDMYRKTRKLGRERATIFTLRVAEPMVIAGLIVWLVIHG